MDAAALAANLANWNERVPHRLRAYGAAEFSTDPAAIPAVVRADEPVLAAQLPGGSVAGLRLAHLQCHIGTDFAIVYTSIGVLCWLPELESRAAAIAALLRPGGVFFLRDLHPMLGSLEARGDDLVVRYPYLPGGPLRIDDPGTYADPEVRLDHTVTYEWSHSIAEVVMALLHAGLQLSSLRPDRGARCAGRPGAAPR